MIHLYTSAAYNYLGKVRTLFQSVRRHHPEFVCHFLLVERSRSLQSSQLQACQALGVHLVLADELMRGCGESWLFGHQLVELATAIKPFFALQLLSRPDCDRIIYLDPDVVLFSRLDDVLEILDRSVIALTPHLLIPGTSREEIEDNEISCLRHGVFNLGFLGLRKSAQAHQFCDWWAQRLRAYCFADITTGLFTDQKWLDLAPTFFDRLAVLRSSRLNVAPWNLYHRQITGSFDSGFMVDGQPLGFYHFTGFDSGAHQAMVSKYAKENLSVQMLVDWYRLYTAKLAPATLPTWSLGSYDNGLPIQPPHRQIYRSRVDLRTAFPNPYATDGRAYVTWVGERGAIEHPQLLG